jgi:hypothetical protein
MSDLIDTLLGRGRRRRIYQRHSCCAVATLLLVDRGVELDGLVLELSRGGVLFREASSFVLDRRGMPVSVKLPTCSLDGIIVNTSRNGYGIRLDDVLSDEELAGLLDDFGPRAAA